MFFDDLSELSFTQLADAYLDLRREGKSISIEQFAEAVPSLREEILTRLPVMVLLNDAMESDNQSGVAISGDVVVEGCQIEEEVGRGAAGVVFRANQPDFDRKVAIKVLNKQRSDDWNARFKIERLAMARLDHPNIVQAYAYVERDEYGCLIMKFVDGYSLRQLISQDCDYQGRVLASGLQNDWDQFAVLAADVADAVAHAHRNGIIHRDLKPGNIMIDRVGKVWVTDFGLTKLRDNEATVSLTGEAIGTPRYMAPEQLHGVCDERSDIYSLGLTLFALASGSASNIRVTYQECDRITADLKELNPEMPQELARVVMKACQPDPAERYQTAEELRIVLDRYLRGRVPDRRRRTRKGRRIYIRKLKQRVAAIAVLSIASLATWVAWKGNPVSRALVAGNTVVASTAVSKKQPVTTKPIVYSDETLLDGIVDHGTKGIDPLVSEVIQRRIDESAHRMNLPATETNLLHSRVEDFLQDDILGEKRISDLIEVYRGSSLAVATRLLRLTRVVERSDLTAKEKVAGVESVRQLAFLVAKERIGMKEADDLEKTLTFGRLMTGTEHSSMRISDYRMRSWLEKVNYRIRDEGNVENVSEEIEELFDKVRSESLRQNR